MDDSLNLLRRQAKRAELRNGREDAFLSAGQLRDDLLRNERSLAFRAKVWKGVGVVVERNANVRVSVREGGRSGEVSRVWEWVGDTGDWEDWREGGRLSGGGASGRVSYGGGMGGAGYGFEDDGESEISLVEDNGLVEPKSLVGVGVGNGMGNGIAGARRAAYF